MKIKKKMNRRFIDYQEILLQELQDPKVAQAYLDASLVEEDPRMFLLALQNVMEAEIIKKKKKK